MENPHAEMRVTDARNPSPKPAGSRFRRIFFGAVFAVYALFVAACAALVMFDPPWGRHVNIGEGFLGFFAALAAGFPWSLSGFAAMEGCERLRINSICDSFINQTFYALCAVGAVINLWLLGALAKWWRFLPWRKLTQRAAAEPVVEQSRVGTSHDR
jgi:hypothetical protein